MYRYIHNTQVKRRNINNHKKEGGAGGRGVVLRHLGLRGREDVVQHLAAGAGH